MINSKRVLCIIPARGGSKRLPGKNLLPLHGTPLIAYAIQAALGSKYIDRTIVSTDDEAIAACTKTYGAEVPFMRPAELASDTAPTVPVLQHAVSFLEAVGDVFDIIALIQPTVPGVISADVDAVIELLESSGMNSCTTMCEIMDRPEHMYALDAQARATPFMESVPTRTQDMPPLARINGAAYAARHNVLMDKSMIVDPASLASILMPLERSTDIDTLTDFRVAQALLVPIPADPSL